MKQTSTCVAAVVFAWMTGGVAWADCESRQYNTGTPPQAEERIACGGEGSCNTESRPQAEERIASCSDGDCHADTPPEGVLLACTGSCD